MRNPVLFMTDPVVFKTNPVMVRTNPVKFRINPVVFRTNPVRQSVSLSRDSPEKVQRQSGDSPETVERQQSHPPILKTPDRPTDSVTTNNQPSSCSASPDFLVTGRNWKILSSAIDKASRLRVYDQWGFPV